LTGHLRGEVVGRAVGEVGVWADEAIDWGGAVGGEARVRPAERLFRRKGGERFDVLHAVVPMALRGEACVLSMAVDISAERRAEGERLEMERRLLHGQKLESLGVLAGGIAHDFNNLLLAIIGNLDLARIELPAESAALEGIGEAGAAARKAADLTRQMLAYSGKGSFAIARIDVNALIEENAHLLRASIARSVTVLMDLAPDLPRVEADPAQVQQVVMNLITNASEAVIERGAEGEGSVRLSTRVGEFREVDLAESMVDERPGPGRYVCIEVRDNGVGMSAATRARMFEPFYTTKFTGRGLGMSAVLGIVRSHRGAILVDSRRGEGTAVRVLFPAAPALAEAEASPAPPPPEVPPATRLSGTVLLADDEPMVREVCGRMIERLGLTVIYATDGREAVDLFEEYGARLALAVLDISMPRLSGWGVLEAIRAKRPELPVILCSGHAEWEAANHAPVAGPVAFIQKPFHLDRLHREVVAAMGGRAG
jgi:signal transduction histidine kinase/CheY-like chemotaxis protein